MQFKSVRRASVYSGGGKSACVLCFFLVGAVRMLGGWSRKGQRTNFSGNELHGGGLCHAKSTRVQESSRRFGDVMNSRQNRASRRGTFLRGRRGGEVSHDLETRKVTIEEFSEGYDVQAIASTALSRATPPFVFDLASSRMSYLSRASPSRRPRQGDQGNGEQQS